MPSKIEEVGAGQEVLKLRDNGYSYQKIRDYLEKNYPELKGISVMAVKRFLEKVKTKNAYNKIQNGIDPTQEIFKKFMKDMKKLSKRIEKYQSKYEQLLDEAIEQRDLDAIQVLGRRLREDNEQIRKTLVSIMQWVNMELQPTYQAKTINITQVNNLLLSFVSELPPECRMKVKEKLSKLLTV